jgi:hypothetical protein
MCCIARHLLLSGLGLLVLLLSSCASRTDAGQAAYQSGDFATAYATWLPSAEAGDAAAQYLVGLLHDQGQGVPEDANEAALWYRLAAEQGHPAAQNNLGMLYFDGRGVSVDYGKAEHWFTRAAEQDFAAAQNNLGVVRLLVAHTPEKEKAEILDSRGNPTVEVDVVLEGPSAAPRCPPGASTGSREAARAARRRQGPLRRQGRAQRLSTTSTASSPRPCSAWTSPRPGGRSTA